MYLDLVESCWKFVQCLFVYGLLPISVIVVVVFVHHHWFMSLMTALALAVLAP